MTAAMVKPAGEDMGPLAKVGIDLGPLVVYFVAYWIAKSVFHLDIAHAALISTGIFMFAQIIAIVVSKLLTGKISAMLWFSGAMVLVLGGLTVIFRDLSFIQMKPTIYYMFIAAILAFGLYTDRPTLKLVLGQAYPGLTDIGWTKLTRNWTFFFIAMAVANEIVRHLTSFEIWQMYKVWGAMPATLVFALANVPMLLKHGLNATAADDGAVPPQG